MRTCACIGLALLTACAGDRAAQPAVGTPVSLADLCVTEGSVEDAGNGAVRVGVPKMRATLPRAAADTAELRFAYLGPTARQEALASGITRVQFGLKLRAQDPCNLVYVMWRLEPETKLVVSVKSNPGEHLSSECGDHGYRDLRPEFSDSLPALVSGEAHRLSAEIRGGTLTVLVDEKQVWEGALDSTAAALNGPVGVRSDNARLEFMLAAGAGASAQLESCGKQQREDD